MRDCRNYLGYEVLRIGWREPGEERDGLVLLGREEVGNRKKARRLNELWRGKGNRIENERVRKGR